MKRLEAVFIILLMVGIVFGTFQQFAVGGALGFEWFVNMLWFAIGFPVLFVLGYAILKFVMEAIEERTK